MDNSEQNEQPKPQATPPISPNKQPQSKAPAFTVKPWESTFQQKGGRSGYSGKAQSANKNHSTKKK